MLICTIQSSLLDYLILQHFFIINRCLYAQASEFYFQILTCIQIHVFWIDQHYSDKLLETLDIQINNVLVSKIYKHPINPAHNYIHLSHHLFKKFVTIIEFQHCSFNSKFRTNSAKQRFEIIDLQASSFSNIR